MVLLRDIKSGTAKPSARAWVALGHHGVPCERWGTMMCLVKCQGPSDTFSSKVTCAHTGLQRSRGADFWRSWMKGLLGSSRRLRLLQVQPHLCHHTARGQQDPAQQGHVPHCSLQRFKSPGCSQPQTTLPCQTTLLSVPSTTGGDEGTQLPLAHCRALGCHPCQARGLLSQGAG